MLGRLEIDDPASIAGGLANGRELLVLVRPEQLVVRDVGTRDLATARVLDTEFYGHDAVLKLHVDLEGGTTLVARTAMATVLPERDSRVALEVRGGVVAWPAIS
jgi:hypothetical protein